MHELGIVVKIAESAEMTAREHGIDKVTDVALEIGEVSGIVPHYLTDCWDYYRKKTEILKDSTLTVTIKEAVTFCEDCEKTYETVVYGKKCPNCGSEKTYLVCGNDCIIKEITVI